MTLEEETRRAEAVALVRKVLRAHGVDSMEWPDGAWGPINVPRKWSGIICDLAAAIQALAMGDAISDLSVRKGKSK